MNITLNQLHVGYHEGLNMSNTANDGFTPADLAHQYGPITERWTKHPMSDREFGPYRYFYESGAWQIVPTEDRAWIVYYDDERRFGRFASLADAKAVIRKVSA